MKTNNSAEGQNFKINSTMQEMHPSIWKFIDKIRNFDESTYSDFLQWNDGKVPTESKIWKNVEKQKLAIVQNYRNVGIMQYLRSVANVLAQ